MNNQEIQDLLLKKSFSIKDTGLTYRIINNWSNQGLLGHFRASEGKWHRLTFMELVEIYIYKELKNVGFSINKMRKVKEVFYTNYGVSVEISKILTNLTYLNHNILLSLYGKNLYLVISVKGDNVSFLQDLYLAEIIAGKSPLQYEIYGENGSSLTIISLQGILKEIGLEIESSNERLGALFNEILEEEIGDSKEVHIIKEKGIGKIKKISTTTHRKLEKDESLNKIAKKPNRKVTSFSNNNGDMAIRIEETIA